MVEVVVVGFVGFIAGTLFGYFDAGTLKNAISVVQNAEAKAKTTLETILNHKAS